MARSLGVPISRCLVINEKKLRIRCLNPGFGYLEDGLPRWDDPPMSLFVYRLLEKALKGENCTLHFHITKLSQAPSVTG